MGWLDRWAPVTSRVLDGPLLPQVEAWTDRSHLEEVAFHDITGQWPGAVGRRRAMRVPAVSRGRHLTCGTIAQLPLRAYRGAEQVDPQPTWAHSTDGQLGDLTTTQIAKWHLSAQSPWYRTLWTVDDLLFYGESLWIATKESAAADDEQRRRFPLRMARVPYDYWAVQEGRIVDADGDTFNVPTVYIAGPHEGILDFGRDTITQAAELEQTAVDVARHPFRLELHQVSGAELTKEQRRDVVRETRTALADADGVLFTNQALETKTHALNSAELLLEGRNGAALDVARHISMPAAMIDATTEGASLEYSTLAGRNQQWIDYGLSLYMDAITARLGMDDVVPAGQRVAFDTTDLTAPTENPTGPVTED